MGTGFHEKAIEHSWKSRWWFQIFFIFTLTWGRFPIWLIFFKWVETTNQKWLLCTVKGELQPWRPLYTKTLVGCIRIHARSPMASPAINKALGREDGGWTKPVFVGLAIKKSWYRYPNNYDLPTTFDKILANVGIYKYSIHGAYGIYNWFYYRPTCSL